MRRRLAVLGVVASMVPVLLGCGPTPTSFEVLDPGVALSERDQHALVRSSDGALWSGGLSGSGVDRYHPGSGAHSSVQLPGGAAVQDLLPGPNGSIMAAVWTPDPAPTGGSLGGQVLRVDADMAVSVVLDLGPGAVPGGLAHDGFTGFWVSDGVGDRILRQPFDGGPGEEFTVPDGVGPSAMVATGPDTVWFVPAFRPGIAKLDATTGHVEVDDSTDPDYFLLSTSLIVGPGGDLWYTRMGSGGMFRFDVDTSTSVEVPVAELWPNALAIGADGAVYATLSCGIDDGLLRVDPVTLETTLYDIGLSNSRGSALLSLVAHGSAFWGTTLPDAGLRNLVAVTAEPEQG